MLKIYKKYSNQVKMKLNKFSAYFAIIYYNIINLIKLPNINFNINIQIMETN